MKIGSWTSLGDLVRYLKEETGEEWLESAIISALFEARVPTVAVWIPNGWPLQQVGKEWADVCASSQLMEAGGIDQFLHELEIGDAALPSFLVSEAGFRFRTKAPLPRSALRFSRSDIARILQGAPFDRLVEAMRRGQYPELKALVMGEGFAVIDQEPATSAGIVGSEAQTDAKATNDRSDQGSKNKGKLTAEQRAEIVRRNQAGETQLALAKAFGVSRTAIYKVLNSAKIGGVQSNFVFGRSTR